MAIIQSESSFLKTDNVWWPLIPPRPVKRLTLRVQDGKIMSLLLSMKMASSQFMAKKFMFRFFRNVFPEEEIQLKSGFFQGLSRLFALSMQLRPPCR
jgi:hypothetical protein